MKLSRQRKITYENLSKRLACLSEATVPGTKTVGSSTLAFKATVPGTNKATVPGTKTVGSSTLAFKYLL